MSGLLVRVTAALFSGFLSSQSSEFTQQYLQRLGGAADELAAIVARFDRSAAAEGLPRDIAVERLRAAPDRFVARQGEDAAATIARFEAVARRYRDLVASPPLLRPFAAMSDPDWPILARVLDDFRPAMPVTADGLVLTAAGFSGGWALGAGASGIVGMRKRRRARATAPLGGPRSGSGSARP